MRFFRYTVGIGMVCALVGGMVQPGMLRAQQAPTPTPLQIQLTTDVPPTAPGDVLTLATPTWTPTGAAPVVLEALDIANVRALPDTAEAQLGVIRAGEFYTVTGRYVNWYQLQYDLAPNGFGWVYGELVRITGDTGAIVDIDPYGSASALDPLAAGSGAESTDEAGGVIATMSPQSGSNEGGSTDATNAPLLPTFTYPPALVRPAATNPAAQPTDTPSQGIGQASGDLPPIAPILLLGGLGVLGLALTSLRRG
ncbi:MAG: SH3 domain-containing protein [bacterium]|nr:SH3 domain-containing protein [bacterium]